MSKEMENLSGKMKEIENGHDMDINKKLIINMRDLNHIMRSLYEGKASQKRILIILNEVGSITQRDLTERLGIKPGSASEILSKLENAGYISRTMSEADRRTANILLTEKGVQAAMEAAGQRSRRHVEMFSCLSENEKTELLVLLEKLNRNWSNRYGLMAEECRGRHHHCGHEGGHGNHGGHGHGHGPGHGPGHEHEDEHRDEKGHDHAAGKGKHRMEKEEPGHGEIH